MKNHKIIFVHHRSGAIVGLNTEIYALDDIVHMDVDKLYKAGFRVVTFDLDRTLAGRNDLHLPLDRRELFLNFKKVGMRVVIISNVYDLRVDRVRSFARQISELCGSECLSVVPNDVNGKKKPHSDIFNYALKLANINNASKAVHFGDQLRTDILGAKSAGYKMAVLVKPFGEGENFYIKFFARTFIEPILRWRYKLSLDPDNIPINLPKQAYKSIKSNKI